MTRFVTAAIFGGLVVYLVAAAPSVLSVLLVLAIALAAAHETSALLGAGAESSVARLPTLAAIFLIVGGAWVGGVEGLSAGLAVGFVLMFAWVMFEGKVEGSVLRFSGASLILLYPVWSLAHTILYLDSEVGRHALLFLLVCVWVCDSGAYFMGSAWGRKKLAPRISPNKTIVGAVGGTLSAAGASIILNVLGFVPWSMLFTICAGLAIALLGQVGDLVESMVKRDAGVKDSGTMVPGHGGMMDRIDALLVAIPAFYYALSLLGGLV